MERLEDVQKKEDLISGPESMFRDSKDENITYCVCCVSFANHGDVPSHLKKFFRGNFSKFKKVGSGRERDSRRFLENHVTNPLHVWCLHKFRRHEKEEADNKSRNEKACKIVVTNAAYVLKDPAGSASDFVRLNNKDQINMGAEYPTKNDGSQYYFELRNVFHDF